MSNNEKGEIIVFGDIREDHKGRLVFSCFSVDGGDRFDNTEVAILTLVKERIEKELDDLMSKSLDGEQ